jgi:hypothetical protein
MEEFSHLKSQIVISSWGGLKLNPKSMIQGVVKPRKCRHCGHHEIGIMTKSGEFLALKTGMKIMVFPDDEGDGDRL